MLFSAATPSVPYNNVLALPVSRVFLIRNSDEINAAVNLMVVCRQTRTILIRYLPFYERNHLAFGETRDLLAYVTVLAPNRGSAIRHISVVWGFGKPAATLAMVSLCHSLQSLTLDLTPLSCYFETNVRRVSQAQGYDQIVSLRGLKEFRLAYTTDGEAGKNFMDHVITNIRGLELNRLNLLSLRLQVKNLEDKIKSIVTQPKVSTCASPQRKGELCAAMRQARIYDIEHKLAISFNADTTNTSFVAIDQNITAATGAMSDAELLHPRSPDEYEWEEDDVCRQREKWDTT